MSINAVSGSNSVNTSSSSNSTDKITDATKKKLEAYASQTGADISNIKTESQAQDVLKAAEAKKEQQQAQAAQANQGGSEAQIKQDITNLAQKMGVEVGNDDKTSDIMDKVATKLTELKASAGTDETKTAEYQEYQGQYDSISAEYSKSQTLSSSMNMMANYNKAALGLAA